MKRNSFLKNAEEVLQKKEIEKAVERSTDKKKKKRDETLKDIPDYEKIREKISDIKDRVIKNHQELLEKFIRNASERGFHIHTASSSDEAREIILYILQSHDTGLVVKGKSMTSEEIELDQFLIRHNIETLETDLGEFIIQLAGEKPAHITAPAIHMTRKTIGRLFQEKLKVDYTESPEELTLIARKYLREKFFRADAGITGANFLVADSGAVVLVENEGNIRMSTTLPSLHIILTGIEKLIPEFKDLKYFLNILAPNGTGQRQTGYVSILTGSDEVERHIVLLDNGRKKFLKNRDFYEALKCIKCGACANACPVFEITGGHPYGGTYSGPIGILWNYMAYGDEAPGDLPYACTLCGACTEICPEKIDLTGMILKLRSQQYRKNLTWREKFIISSWKTMFTNQETNKFFSFFLKIFRRAARGKGVIHKLPFLEKWTKERDIEIR